MKLSDKPKIDRPREKLKAKGPKALSDFELLQALVGSGNKQADVSKIAKDIKKLLQKHGAEVTYEQLEQITGLGSAKITELLSAFELSNRYLAEADKPIINSAEDAVNEVKEIRDKKQEYFVCLTLDGANRLIAKRTISIGTLSASLVHPREVFADAITDRAASVIVAHNHPSGNIKPSPEDIKVTKRLKSAAKLLGIGFKDHVIVCRNNHESIINA